MEESWSSELKCWLVDRSASLGFELAGITSVGAGEDPGETLDASRFRAWIEAGRAGEMDYLKRRDAQGELLRSSVLRTQPWARSVIVCAVNYQGLGPLSIDPTSSEKGWIARYAWGGALAQKQTGGPPLEPADYHDVLLTRLQQLALELMERSGGDSKCYVDTGPMVERSLAARAGIGWIGKNTCVLHQERGSWLLLGVIVSSLQLPAELAAMPAADRCGSCTRCIDACPTHALTAPHEMDASRCIAYLTIEKKGAISPDLRPLMGRQVFGCDICQDVCPWNRRTAPSDPPAMPVRTELINPDLGWLASMDAPTFKRWFKGSPLERTRRSRLHRNVSIAMGNSGEERFLPQLEAWSQSGDPVLAEAATWARDQLQHQAEQDGGVQAAASPGSEP